MPKGVFFEGNSRSIGRDPVGYFELDGIGFFMEGFKKGEASQSRVERVMQRLDILRHHLANHCLSF